MKFAHCNCYNTDNLPDRYRTDIPVESIQSSDEEREKRNNEIMRRNALQYLRKKELKKQRKIRRQRKHQNKTL